MKMDEKMKEFGLCGYIDCPSVIEDLSGFNVWINVHAINEEKAWEKLFVMTPEQFKKKAEPSWEDDAFEKVWIEEVEDANDGIDWYFDDVDVIEEKEKESEDG
tara:strand:- start:206 stop:514 length:309 start_codon:yes stop_codon:yes gene_type:complete